MKEYKIQCKEVDTSDDSWCNVGVSRYFYSLEDAKKEIEVQKSNDKDFLKNLEHYGDWEYRILVRDISEWEVL